MAASDAKARRLTDDCERRLRKVGKLIQKSSGGKRKEVIHNIDSRTAKEIGKLHYSGEAFSHRG